MSARRLMAMMLELLARMASWPAALPNAVKTAFLVSKSSMTASMTRSALAAAFSTVERRVGALFRQPALLHRAIDKLSVLGACAVELARDRVDERDLIAAGQRGL